MILVPHARGTKYLLKGPLISSSTFCSLASIKPEKEQLEQNLKEEMNTPASVIFEKLGNRFLTGVLMDDMVMR
jgi:hypothetical protein